MEVCIFRTHTTERARHFRTDGCKTCGGEREKEGEKKEARANKEAERTGDLRYLYAVTDLFYFLLRPDVVERAYR